MSAKQTTIAGWQRSGSGYEGVIRDIASRRVVWQCGHIHAFSAGYGYRGAFGVKAATAGECASKEWVRQREQEASPAQPRGEVAE